MFLNVLIPLVVMLLFMAALVLLRTLRFSRPSLWVEPIDLPEVDADTIAAHLAEALRLETISIEGQKPPVEALEKLHAKMGELYPTLHRTLKRQVIGGYSLLYTWPGSNEALDPVLLMAHMDVVPADASQWQHPPFEGHIADGSVWGRGALDMKNMLVSILEAVETLTREEYQPERTLHLAFGHDEEVLGSGAKAIADWLEEQGVKLEAVLDEGGMLVDGLIPGVECPVAVVGTTEKGYMSVELKVEANPGHSSSPPPHTAIGILAEAIAHLEANPMPARPKAMRPLIQGLGREAPFLLQMKFANLWLFGGLERRKLLASPKMAASIRTTTAVTMINGGVKDNILPPQATAIVNFRLLPGDSVADVCNHIRRMVDDERVVLTTLPGAHPAPEPSDTDSPAYRSLEKTIRQVFNNPPVTPYLMLGATDSRHFCGLSRNVYRFEPLLMTNTDLDMIHGVDERVSVEGLGRMVQFFQLLIQRWTSKMVSTDPGL